MPAPPLESLKILNEQLRNLRKKLGEVEMPDIQSKELEQILQQLDQIPRQLDMETTLVSETQWLQHEQLLAEMEMKMSKNSEVSPSVERQRQEVGNELLDLMFNFTWEDKGETSQAGGQTKSCPHCNGTGCVYAHE